MHTMTVTLRTVTPLFLGGVAQVPSGVEDTRDGPIPVFRVPAEIRPPSIRGAMRFWFRALWGDEESRALREEEARYFGSTATGQCPVRMQWLGKPPESRPWPREGLEAGVRYLGFTLNTHVKEDGSKIRRIREYVESGQEFTLVFRGVDLPALKAHWAATWLLGHLGGIGLRSRRGFGSLSIQEVAGCPFPLPLAKDAQSAKEVAATVGEGLQSLVKELGVRLRREPGAFPLLHQGQPIRIVAGSGDGWRGWDQALNGIGLGLQQFRRGLKPLNRRRPFGLPLRASEKERHASPLVIHVGEMHGELKFASLTAFHSARLMGDSNASRPQSVVHSFVESFPGGVSVTIPEA
jgi:CRISPR-associated protein Cmr1